MDAYILHLIHEHEHEHVIWAQYLKYMAQNPLKHWFLVPLIGTGNCDELNVYNVSSLLTQSQIRIYHLYTALQCLKYLKINELASFYNNP